jgi:hypothetical protein
MQTTALIIEYLVGGTLILLGLFYLVCGLCPGHTQSWLQTCQALKEQTILVTFVLAAVAYAVGVISEPIGRMLFEWFPHRWIACWRLSKYLKEYRLQRDRSPLFKGRKDEDLVRKANEVIGQMRFHVLKENPQLYHEIESQINRLRLLRVLVVAELLALVATGWHLWQNPSSGILRCVLGALLSVTLANLVAVCNRLARYARAVERSYAELVFCSGGPEAPREKKK